VARLGLRWGRVAWVGLAASCAFGLAGCTDEDEPDPVADAATDARGDTRSDVSVGTDVTSDGSVVDQREAGTPDASADTRPPDSGTPESGAPDGRSDAAPDTGTPEGGNCVGGGDAARDGAIGMMAVQSLRCANCHQDEPVDAGLILSGRLTSIVNEAGVFPANLTPDPMTGLGCWTDDQIINAFMNGINEKGQMLCGRMPMFAGRVDAGVAQEIVNFLRSIQAVHKEIPETLVCPPPPEPQAEPRPEPQPDGGDADGPDAAAPDGAAPDAGPDGTAPDGGPDSTPDAGGDVATDTGPDDADTDGG